MECANRCRCSCHCSAADGLQENTVPTSPQKAHGLFVTLRKKFSQIMKRDVHEVTDPIRTLPRARSSDRGSSGRSSGISRSRTLPRKTAASHGCTNPSTPVRPPDRGSDSFNLTRGRSFHRQSSKTHDAVSPVSFSGTLSPSRLQKAVCCFRHDGWNSATPEDGVVPLCTDIREAFGEVNVKPVSTTIDRKSVV